MNSEMRKDFLIPIITGFFIYFRKLDYYKTMPRKNIIVSLAIGVWTYLAMKDHWYIIYGLILLNLFGKKMN